MYVTLRKTTRRHLKAPKHPRQASPSSQRSPRSPPLPGQRTSTRARPAVSVAKTRAGFEFLGTWCAPASFRRAAARRERRPCLPYIAIPRRRRPRDSWYADPAKVFDNLYFAAAESTRLGADDERGDHPPRHDLCYTRKSCRRRIKTRPRSGSIKYLLVSHAHATTIGGGDVQTR